VKSYEERTPTLAIGLPALAFLSDWQITSCIAAPQTVQSTERPIDIICSIALGIVGNLSGGDMTDAGNNRAGRMREAAG